MITAQQALLISGGIGIVLLYFSLPLAVAYVMFLAVITFGSTYSRDKSTADFKPYSIWISPHIDTIAKDHELSDHPLDMESLHGKFNETNEESGYHIWNDGITFSVINDALLIFHENGRRKGFASRLNRRETIAEITMNENIHERLKNKKYEHRVPIADHPAIYIREKYGEIIMGITTPESSAKRVGIGPREDDDGDEIELAKIPFGLIEIGLGSMEKILTGLRGAGWEASQHEEMPETIWIKSKYFEGAIRYL